MTVCCYASGLSQHTVFFQNNTGLDYQLQIIQNGNINMDTSQWNQLSTIGTAWNFKEAVFEMNPDTSFSNGDTSGFFVNLSSGSDTIVLKTRLVGPGTSPTLFYSVSGSSFSHTWSSDSYFHSEHIVVEGIEMTIKYKVEIDSIDGKDNVVFALQENFIYALDSTDFLDPYVINVMSYNIQHMPLITDNFYERGVFLPPLFSPYQDVVIFEELFSDSSRNSYVNPAMMNEGFSYFTTILNDTALPTITSNTNGGVIIYSKWPIEFEAEYKYLNCSNNSSFDCLASKGIKYAKINKLGQSYHIFGTHMEAGGSTADVQIRLEQYGEMNNFISAQGIPVEEAVILGGDLNTGPKDGFEYDAIRDSIMPIIPLHIGYYESTFSYADTGKIIDHVWGMADNLLPIEAYNSVFTFRSVDSIMWDIYDFSDHRTVIGRFKYPDILTDNIDTNLCSGDSLAFNITSNSLFAYQWKRNGNPVSGATSNFYIISNPDTSSIGLYSCDVTNSQVFGAENDVLSQLFYPNGPKTYAQSFSFQVASIGFQNPCGLGDQEQKKTIPSFKVVPSINQGRFVLEISDKFLKFEVRIYNSLGNLVVARNIYNNNDLVFDVSEEKPGIYLVYIMSSKSIIIRKFIKY